jgi:hypothetical protein
MVLGPVGCWHYGQVVQVSQSMQRVPRAMCGLRSSQGPLCAAKCGTSLLYTGQKFEIFSWSFRRPARCVWPKTTLSESHDLMLLRSHVNNYWQIAVRPGFDSRQGLGKIFYLRHRVQAGSGAHSVSYPLGTGASSRGGEAVGWRSWPLTSLPITSSRLGT